MRTIAMLCSKGGTGKSTLACCLAVAALPSKTFLLDADPQGSSMSWGERRTDERLGIDRIDWETKSLATALDTLRHAEYDYVFVDTPGVWQPVLGHVDLILVPARPSVLDFEGARKTTKALAGQPFALVMNAVPPNAVRRIEDASQALDHLGKLAHPFIGNRIGFVDAILAGQGITEFSPESRGADEIRGLWQWIKDRLEEDHAQAVA